MPGGQVMQVSVPRTRTFAVLLMVDFMFVVLHLLTRVVTWRGDPLVKRHEFLDLDAEVSFPTWWQQSQLLVAAALCFLVAAAPTDPAGRRRHWMGLAAIFVYLSADEGTQFHEGLIEPMRRAFDITDGPLTFAWVIPGAMALLVFVLVYLRFWWRLPARPRRLVAVAGAFFVTGALGFEMASGAYKTATGIDRGYQIVIAVEEGLEMLGASVFLLALLTVLALRQGPEGVSLHVVDGRVTAPRSLPDRLVP